MKPSSELHQLIKSLSKTEKTYFKKFASRHYKESNTFTLLFDELDGKKINGSYEESEIKGKFKSKKFIKQLPVTKNYLYNNILKSLNLYYTEDNIDIKLSGMINSAMILYRKELFGQCLKLITRTKKLAEKHDKPSRVLEAIHIERQALRIRTSLNEAEDALLKNYDEEIEVLKKLKNISEYRKLYDKIVIYASAKGFSKNSEDSKQLEKLLNTPLLKDYSKAEYFQSKVLFLLIHTFTNNLKDKHEVSRAYGKKMLELMGDSADNKEIAAYEYILILQELMVSSYHLNRIDESDYYYNRLLTEQDDLLRFAPLKVKNFLRIRTVTSKLSINITTGDFDNNLHLIDEMLSLSKKNEQESYRDEIIVTNYLAAVTFFALEKYEDALYYLNRIFNSKDFKLREDLQISSRVFYLILHYELGNLDSLEYYIKSTYRFLKKKRKLKDFENLLLKFLEQSTSAATGSEFIKLLIQTRKELNKSVSKAIGNFINIDAWIDSKISGKKYIDTVKENFLKSLKIQ